MQSNGDVNLISRPIFERKIKDFDLLSKLLIRESNVSEFKCKVDIQQNASSIPSFGKAMRAKTLKVKQMTGVE